MVTNKVSDALLNESAIKKAITRMALSFYQKENYFPFSLSNVV
ncbi:MAG: hypothetical protein V4685_03610 [Bacteroidota bacterium]